MWATRGIPILHHKSHKSYKLDLCPLVAGDSQWEGGENHWGGLTFMNKMAKKFLSFHYLAVCLQMPYVMDLIMGWNQSEKILACLERNVIWWPGQGSKWWFMVWLFSSVAQSCPTLCDPMDCSTPGFSVHHQLLELTQSHVCWVGDNHPTISSFVVPFSSCLQSFPALWSF